MNVPDCIENAKDARKLTLQDWLYCIQAEAGRGNTAYIRYTPIPEWLRKELEKLGFQIEQIIPKATNSFFTTIERYQTRITWN